jgi:hypothetical protein
MVHKRGFIRLSVIECLPKAEAAQSRGRQMNYESNWNLITSVTIMRSVGLLI